MPEVPVIIERFIGVNNTDPAMLIQDGELSVCDNFDIGRGGELSRRPGWTKVNTTAFAASELRLIGHFKTSTIGELIAWNADSLYKSSDGINWSLIGTAGSFPGVEFGVQYTDKFYILRSTETILEYDGTNLTALAGTPTATYGIVHKDRLFLFNTKSTTLASRLRFSDIANFGSWPSTNFIDINPGDGDWCVGLSVLSDILLVFKSQSIRGLYATGDPSTWSLREVNTEIGAVSHYSILQVENFVYFTSPTGIYRTDGVSFDEISYPIRKELQNRVITQASLNLDMAIRYEDRIIYMVHPSPTVHSHYTYYFKVNGWTRWPHAGSIKPGPYVNVLSDTPVPQGLYAGDHGTNGIIYRLSDDGVFQDNGVNYTCHLETKDFNFDAPHEVKRGKWASPILDGAASVRLSFLVDAVERAISTITTTAGYKAYKIPGPGYFRTCKIKLTNTGSTEFKVYNFTLVLHSKSKIHKSGV